MRRNLLLLGAFLLAQWYSYHWAQDLLTYPQTAANRALLFVAIIAFVTMLAASFDRAMVIVWYTVTFPYHWLITRKKSKYRPSPMRRKKLRLADLT